MDEPRDRTYSRAPQFEDFLALCTSLNNAKVDYMVIGGFAVILHGSTRTTKDIDLLVNASAENIRTIKQALASLPDNAIALIADDDVQKYQVVRVADEIVIDLMQAACGIDYDQALNEGIDHMTIEGINIPVASKELLIRMKDTFRDSDKSDIAFLKLRIEEEKQQE